MEGGDVAELYVNFGHQTEILEIEVFDANTGKSWHFIDKDEFIPRNSNYNRYYYWIFDGTTINPVGQKVFTVPDGDYYMTLSVLKALGDRNNPDHWETWTSQVFTIERP